MTSALSSPPVLTDEQLAEFDEQGFVIIKGALSAEDAESYRQSILSMMPPSLEIPAVWGSYDGRIKPMAGPGRQTFDTPDLLPLMTNDKLYGAASQLLGSTRLRVMDGSVGITIRNDAHTDRPLSQTLHLDASVPTSADDFTFDQQELQVGGCYYLTDVEAGGGGIHVVPGGHKIVEAEARAAGSGGRHLHQDWKQIEHLTSVEITGEAGDFALLHHLMPHGASHNRNSTARVAYFVRWVREDQTWGAGAKPAPNSYDDDQLAAMGDLGRKLFGVDDW
ncbi:phytanoyl-CoA dioxygenase family protein [Microlunatus soli]|uniref:Ectoine hydroxylase-related dioxygenase, phytanoyl-CoA dioxygenase (PhyH) family n=1 Tax=Microlunatus soli TaxID=630515 RepID=A0A1H1TDN5_9ACTN|nr:phytanoyl-CoA dioxygenase family protein [Microlunatus soli]SDS58244.1 Ectoine hydroxylase-related dioxygenase, phytanoyl-CoA dioxygenase (PhyH) family [Microlunatus soli]